MRIRKPASQLGMDSNVTRRDFLNGVGITVGASLLGADPFLLETFGVPDASFAPEKDPNYYPPAKTGLRGSHVGSFEVASSASTNISTRISTSR